MLLRTWRTGYDRGRLDELEEFARTRSTPMFESFAGCLGHIYAHDADEYVTISLWIGRHAIRAAEESDLYRSTVADITAAGFLTGEQSVDVLEVSSWQFAWEGEPEEDEFEDD